MNLNLINKYIIIIKQYLLIFYGNFRTENFLSYIEYFSWISGSIISLIGLLSIFLSIHYQTDLLKAKTILRKLNIGDKCSQVDLINYFKEYFFITTDDMRGYIESVSLFKFISIVLSILWTFSGIAYVINLESYGGILLVLLSTILLCLIIIKIIGKFESVYKKNLLLFPDFFDINKLQKKLNTSYDLGTDVIIPIMTIKVLFDDNKITYSYRSNINLFNFGVVLLIRKQNQSGFYFNLGVKLSKPPDGITNVENTKIKDTINSNSYLNKEFCTLDDSKYQSCITLFINDRAINYEAKMQIIQEEGKLMIECYPTKIINQQAPDPIKTFYSETVIYPNKIFVGYLGCPELHKTSVQKEHETTTLKKWFSNFFNK